MTRTILNWSEVIELYQGKSIKKDSKLKKWSEMDKSESPKCFNISKQVEQREKQKAYGFTNMKCNVQNPLSDVVHEYENGTPVKAKIKNLQLTETKITLEEIFHDTLMQDTESIPKLLDADVQTLPKRFSEQENLLSELLEMNLQNQH